MDKARKFFLAVFAAGCLAHFGMAFSVNQWLSTDGGPALLQNSDEITYYAVGKKIAAALREGAPMSPAFEGSKDPHHGYYYVIGGLLYAGAEPLQMRLVNAGISILAPILFVFLIREAGGGILEQKIAFALSMFWPSSVFWTSLILKEALGYALTALVLLASARIVMRQNFSFQDMTMMAASVLALSFFRSYASLLLLAVLTLVGAILMRERGRMVLLGCIITAIVTVLNPDMFELFWRVMGQRPGYDEQYWNAIQIGSARGGSSVTLETSIFTKLWLFVTFPLPWQATTLFQKLAIPEVLLSLVLVPSAILGCWLQLREKNPVAVQLMAVFLIFVGLYTYIVNNLGTLFRIKSSLSIYFLYFVAVGLASFWKQVKLRRLQVGFRGRT